LVEILVVLVIVGILSALAIPKFFTSMGESQLDADANRLMLDLQWAKTEAPKESTGPNRTGARLYVILDTARRSWTIYRDNGNNTFDGAPTDTVIRIDSLAKTTRFGFLSAFPVPAATGLPLGTGVSVAANGFGASDPGNDDCVDGQAFPASTANSWQYVATGGGKIVACGGTIGAMSGGAIYLTSSRSNARAYAIVYNKLTPDLSSYALRKYLWTSAGWTKQ
jgi:type II secretory pathway pseudopilin PulG